jgi:hypothetical protein
MAMPYAALAIWGTSGAVAVLLMIFMAVTSAMSSEMMATATMFTHDVYQAYFNPRATSDQLLRCSRIACVVFAIVVASVAVALNHAGFGVNYIVTAIGIVVDSAVVPMVCTVMWKKQSKLAVIASPLISSAIAIMAWLLTAYTHFGQVTLASTSENLPLATGNITSILVPLVLTPLFTYLKPDDYDWDELKEIKTQDELDTTTSQIAQRIPEDTVVVAPESAIDVASKSHGYTDEVKENTRLLRARKFALIASVFMTLSYLLLWPIPMYATKYVFSRVFFKGWIVVVFLWSFYAALTITILPLWEGRKSIKAFVLFMSGKVTGKKETSVIEATEGVSESTSSSNIEKQAAPDVKTSFSY